MLRDLFDNEHAGWLTDPDLLHRLAMDKLVKAQAALIEDGWKWAEIMPDIPRAGLPFFTATRIAGAATCERFANRVTETSKIRLGRSGYRIGNDPENPTDSGA
jgi:hypothetical protein